jgi:hypothetical protein
MENPKEFELLFDKEIAAELAERQVDLERELHKANPNLQIHTGRSLAKGAQGQRDAVQIITAVGALAPVVVPIVTELIKRLLPHVETKILIEKKGRGRSTIKIIKKET